jgi:cation transport ATPase
MTHSAKTNQEQAITTATSAQPVLRMPLLISLGVIFWFAAAMIIRFLGPTFFVPGNIVLPLVAFIVTIPIAWVFFWLGITLAGAKGTTVMPTMVVMSFTAMLLDGIALTFFPTLYGPTFAIGGAWILWGLGLIQMIAFVQSRRA